MLPILGFPKERVPEIHEVMAHAARSLRKCAICGKQLNGKFKEEFLNWFYEPADENEATVKQLVWTVEQMRDRLEEPGGKLVVSYHKHAEMKGDYGAVDSLPHKLARSANGGKAARGAVNVRDSIDSYYGYGNIATIKLSDKVFELPDTSNRGGLSQLVVFLHELSHWAAGTRDLKAQSKQERSASGESGVPKRCYGTSEGVVLAVDRGKYEDGTMRAVQNADNVAFFVASFL